MTKSRQKTMHKLVFSAIFMAAYNSILVHAMTASPKNLEVEQCITWSKPSENSRQKKTRGFKTTSENDVCIESKTIVLKQHGNAMQHWLTDVNDITVLQDENGDFVYANLDQSGKLLPTKRKVGLFKPRMGQLKNLRDSFESIDCNHFLCQDELSNWEPDEQEEIMLTVNEATSNLSVNGTSHQRRKLSPTGIRKNLVVLMRFKDHTNRRLPSRQDMDILFNGDERACKENPAICKDSGSVKNYWKKFSHGKLDIQSTVTEWVTVDFTEAEAADNNWGTTTKIHDVIKNALNLVNRDTNFLNFDQNNDQWIDAITIVHSGNAWKSKEGVNVLDYNINPALWGTSGNEIGRIGVICHELGHYLGILDLYDTERYQGSSNNGFGLGLHALMANSWGFDYSQKYPSHISPWTMMQLGLVVPAVPHKGVNAIQRIDLTPSANQKSVYKIGDGAFGYPVGEYLLLCYAKFMKYDTSTFQGILIYHVDERAGFNGEGFPGQTGWPQNGNHYKIALEQADGYYELERGIDHGDAGDFFKQDWSLTPYGVYYKGSRVAGFPNTNTYQGGKVQQTHLTIQVLSAPNGESMEFLVSGRDDLPNAPAATTPSPTLNPTPLPTVHQTPSPTAHPTNSLQTPAPTIARTPQPTPFPTQPPTPIITPSPTTAPTPRPTLSPSVRPTTSQPTPSPTQQPTTTPPTTGILIIASEDFEDSNFAFASMSQLKSTTNVATQSTTDGGKQGTKSAVACGSNCKLANNRKSCVGSRCINLMKNTQRNSNLVLGVDPKNRSTIVFGFKVYTRKPEKKGNAVCLDFSLNNGGNWNQVRCYNTGDIGVNRWTNLQADVFLPVGTTNNRIVQFRIRSLQTKGPLFIDDIEVTGIS
ncbi:secreted metalloprotease [Nitzschia inconspicua]|uniref:Secreted metalloprotease n=1 Tax=Nitzschia inconspicua TaxID=303405 RepID=A0A9K3PTA9_9STRA|nr:secreted metalloprotease [Nitzschia inconspicua]